MAGYRAPEMLAGLPYTTKADIYSLGSLIYEVTHRMLPLPHTYPYLHPVWDPHLYPYGICVSLPLFPYQPPLPPQRGTRFTINPPVPERPECLHAKQAGGHTIY